MDTITEVLFPRFNTLFVSGQISMDDKLQIKEILNTMSTDEYAGYSPTEQKKYKQIENTLAKYQKAKIYTIHWKSNYEGYSNTNNHIRL